MQCCPVVAPTQRPTNEMPRRKMRIGAGVCHALPPTARKLLILNGEMSEWMKEHAWKGMPAASLTHADTHQRARHQRLPATTVSVAMSPYATVFDRGFRVHVTQS